MTAPAVTNTFVANSLITAGGFNTNFSDLVTYISNRNDGAATWDRVLVTSGSAVPLIVNNSTGTSNIANFQDNGSTVFQIIDGGNVYMNATKRFYVDNGVHTYFTESSDNKFRIVANDSVGFDVTDTFVAIPTTNKLALNSGATTFFVESSTHVLDAQTNSTLRLRISATGVVTISNLAGVGSRTVVADANGVLSAP